MAQFKLAVNKEEHVDKKRMNALENFKNPQFIFDQIISAFQDGDFESSTDFIAAYVKNSPKYNTQDEFAEKIGTTRQTLSRMFAHENVSMNIYFECLRQIKEDIGAN
ncbi:MAG: helix-turn-helix domain-containing protein [Bacteriovoracaceae bacterium]|jgi:DNA-binding phage protein|nr:helix-turn-helix domain-containing protein [Bacteriovoracaceae bacterium]